MQEGTLTWSLRRNSLPLPALRAHWPLRAPPSEWLFGASFLHHFSYCFLYSLFMFVWWILIYILAPCWHHFQCFLHDCFEHRFYMDFSSILQGFLYVFWSISVGSHGPTSNWRKLQKHLFLNYFCIVYTFANTCFFYSFRDMFRCSLFAPFVVIFCTNVGVILAWFWHQN